MTNAKWLEPYKIDVHHHIFLPQLGKQKASQNAQVGWNTPPENVPWNLAKSLAAMQKLGVVGAILSYPAGVPENLVDSPFRREDTGVSEYLTEEEKNKKNKDIVRELNVQAKDLCESKAAEGRFGWFACLPDLRNVEGEMDIVLL